MKALRTNGSSVFLYDMEEPVPTDGQVKVRATCSLVSGGTELHYALSSTPDAQWGHLGYCSAGIVEALGSNVVDLHIGDRVIAMGWNYAIHAEVIVVPQKLVVRVPPAVSLESAVFANLAATALHAVHRAGDVCGKWVLVLGAGLVGQLVSRVVAIYGGRVLLVDRIPERLAFVTDGVIETLPLMDEPDIQREVIRMTAGHGMDMIFLCTAGANGFPVQMCLDLVARAPDANRRGAIIAVGRFPLQIDLSAEVGNIDIRMASRCGTGYRDDAYAHGKVSYSAPPGEATVDSNLATCLQLIKQERLSVAGLISHRLPFENAVGAYELLQDVRRAMGIIFTYH